MSFPNIDLSYDPCGSFSPEDWIHNLKWLSSSIAMNRTYIKKMQTVEDCANKPDGESWFTNEYLCLMLYNRCMITDDSRIRYVPIVDRIRAALAGGPFLDDTDCIERFGVSGWLVQHNSSIEEIKTLRDRLMAEQSFVYIHMRVKEVMLTYFPKECEGLTEDKHYVYLYRDMWMGQILENIDREIEAQEAVL